MQHAAGDAATATEAEEVAAPPQDEGSGPGTNASRRLPSRSISQNEAHHASSEAPKRAAKLQRRVWFNELVHERIFSVMPSPRQSGDQDAAAIDTASLSSDGEADSKDENGSLEADEKGPDGAVDEAAAAGQPAPAATLLQQQAGVSAALHSRILLPPPPSPPDSPPRAAASSPRTAVPKSPLQQHLKRGRKTGGNSGGGGSSNNSGGSRSNNDMEQQPNKNERRII